MSDLYQRAGHTNPYMGIPAQLAPTATLYEMAQSLLLLAKRALTADGLPCPSRQVIYPAPIPADCEQIAVLYNGWTSYPSGTGATRTENFRWAGGFSVVITRKTPAMAAPSAKNPTPTPEAMKAAALVASRDAEAMLGIVRSLDEYSDVSVVVQAPAGGLQTVELDITIPASGGGL